MFNNWKLHNKRFMKKKMPLNVSPDILYQKHKSGQCLSVQAKQICLNVLNSFIGDGLDMIQACQESAKRCGISVKSMNNITKEKVFAESLKDNSPAKKSMKKVAVEKLTSVQVDSIRKTVCST